MENTILTDIQKKWLEGYYWRSDVSAAAFKVEGGVLKGLILSDPTAKWVEQSGFPTGGKALVDLAYHVEGIHKTLVAQQPEPAPQPSPQTDWEPVEIKSELQLDPTKRYRCCGDTFYFDAGWTMLREGNLESYTLQPWETVRAYTRAGAQFEVEVPYAQKYIIEKAYYAGKFTVASGAMTLELACEVMEKMIRADPSGKYNHRLVPVDKPEPVPV